MANNRNMVKPVISLIMPTYNEEENLNLLHESLVSTATKMQGYDFEFIFVDDFSRDKTPEILKDLCGRDNRVNTIRLSRNCGSHAAVAAGLYYCRGDVAIIAAADLQDPPETVMPKMMEQWNHGFKVVWGIRDKRKKGENLWTIIFSWLYYFLVKILTDVKQPLSGVGAILLDRVVINAFNQTPEKNSSVSMLIAWLGFSQTNVHYVREARHAGRSKWAFTKKIKLSLDTLISFSYVPVRFMSIIGIICTLAGLIYATHIFINKLLNNIAVTGWSSIMIALLLIGGIQMIMLGIFGEYLWRTYDETRARPRYVIEKNTIQDGQSGA